MRTHIGKTRHTAARTVALAAFIAALVILVACIAIGCLGHEIPVWLRITAMCVVAAGWIAARKASGV